MISLHLWAAKGSLEIDCFGSRSKSSTKPPVQSRKHDSARKPKVKAEPGKDPDDGLPDSLSAG